MVKPLDSGPDILDEQVAAYDGVRPRNPLITTDQQVRVTGREQSTMQVYGVISPVYGRQLPRHEGQRLQDYRLYREMRKDPTIALARAMSINPLAEAGWSIEATDGAPEGAKELIQRIFDDQVREFLVKSMLEGCCDYGFAAFEKVFDVYDEPGDDLYNHIYIKKFKPLLQTMTDVMIDVRTGAFVGFRQPSRLMYPRHTLELPNALLINIDLEGTDWFGLPQMEHARMPYEHWLDVESAASRYDRKMAGSFWRVGYPQGVSPTGFDSDGNANAFTDNFIIAKGVIDTLVSSGAVAHPTQSKRFIDDADKGDDEAWQVELMTDPGKGQDAFVSRQKYLDALKVRAFGIPERSVLEGQFGTKAEAGAHADMAITCMECRYGTGIRQLNWHAVNQVLRMNWGKKADNTVFLKPTPLSDDSKTYLRQLYIQLLQVVQKSGKVEAENIDTEQVRTELGIPSKSEEEVDDEKMPATAPLGQAPGAAGAAAPGSKPPAPGAGTKPPGMKPPGI